MSKTGTVASIAIFAAILVATPIVEAQFPAPPQIGLEPPQALPARDISAEVERMTKRYGLSEDKAKIVHAILEEQARKARDVRSLRTFIAGGDCVPVSTQERFHALFGIPVREAYGMTETGPSAVNPAHAIRSGSLGKPLDGVEVRVVDSDGKDVSDGKIGEIAVRSPAIFAEYWDDPAATREVLRDGWLYSGDLARRDADGYRSGHGRV